MKGEQGHKGGEWKGPQKPQVTGLPPETKDSFILPVGAGGGTLSTQKPFSLLLASVS